MNRLWFEFERTLASEIGTNLARLFVGSLFRSSKGDIAVATDLYHKIGVAWAPVVVGWRDWVIERARHDPPILIMRDAKPLTAAPTSDMWPRVWLNRQNCGVVDEISGDETSKHPLLGEYLEQHGLDQPFTFVDSGCWGTIVRDLHLQSGLVFQPLFFFSHNRAIPGFLNDLGVDEKNGEILNDSMECCFPNFTVRPASLIRGSKGLILPELFESDVLSVKLGRTALSGVSDGTARRQLIDPVEAVERLLELSAIARGGIFTGILPHSSPTWSRGDQFLRDWPRELSWS